MICKKECSATFLQRSVSPRIIHCGPIRKMVDEILKEMSPKFQRLYSDVGRPSIAPGAAVDSLKATDFCVVLETAKRQESRIPDDRAWAALRAPHTARYAQESAAYSNPEPQAKLEKQSIAVFSELFRGQFLPWSLCSHQGRLDHSNLECRYQIRCECPYPPSRLRLGRQLTSLGLQR